MAVEKTFQQFYDENLAGALTSLESGRKAIVRYFAISLFSLIAGVLVLIAGSSGNGGATVLGMVLLVGGVIGFVVYYNKRKAYVTAFKETIVRRVIQFLDPALDYQPGLCVSEGDYKQSGLYLQSADRYWGDDLVTGKRDKTLFSFSELHTQQRVGSGKDAHYETIFRGLFFIADFNKNFSGRTYVWSEAHPQLNFFNKLFSSFASGLEMVMLESPEFEKRFIVYSSDQVEARYILTPSFMEKMMKLQDMIGRRVTFSFVNTNIFVAVPITEKLFEPSVFSASNYANLEDYYNTILIVFYIIDELKLNERLWNKR
jgi:hypothetical protein